MGLLLRQDAYYAPTPDGVYFLTHQGSFTLLGDSWHALITRLAPHLDGRHDLDQLTAHLPAERQTVVRNLITHLISRGVVSEVSPSDGVDASRESTVPAYGHQRALVLGGGRLMGPIASVAQRSGLDDVRVVSVAPEEPEAHIRAALAGTDVVFHVADQYSVGRTYLVDRLCAEMGIRVAQAVQLGDQVWLGPMGSIPADGCTWTAGHRRWAARRPRPAPCVSAEITHAGAVAVAAQLVQGVLRTITEAAREQRDQLISVDLATLRSESHRFIPHPFTLPHRPPSRSGVLGGPRLGREDFSQRAVALTGDQAGVVGAPTEQNFDQLPLRVCSMEVSDPVGLLDANPQVITVTGSGLDFATARHRAALRALATYASLMVDPRNLVTVDGRALPPDALRALRTGQSRGFVRGYGCTDLDPVLVDARDAFPALSATTGPYVSPPGVSAAYSWEDALVQGLIAHCRGLTLNEAVESALPFPRITPSHIPLDADGERSLQMLEAIGRPLAVYDITASLGVPTVMSYLGTAPAACAAGLTLASALARTLEETVLCYQASLKDRPVFGPPPLPSLPRTSRGEMGRSPNTDLQLDQADLVQILQRRGLDPVAVPLDHDPAVHAIMPYIVHVVLHEA